MKWGDFLKIIVNQPVIETPMLVSRAADVPKVEVQLSRWVKLRRLIKIKRGAYLLAEPYRKIAVDYGYLATAIYRPSYISFEYALADYGLIPEAVHAITAVTTRRPHRIFAEGKLIIYRHVKKELFWGYLSRGNSDRQTYYAEPEKALLDYFYFVNGQIDLAFLDEMRIQNLEILDTEKLWSFAKRFKSAKIGHAARLLIKYVEKQNGLKKL